MYIPKSLQEENVHNNCLVGLRVWTNWSVDLTKIKIPLCRTIFFKMGTKVSVLRKGFEGHFLWVKWSEWVSEWVKWCFFGPLNLFIFRYVKEGVLGNNNIGIKKCTTTFLWVLNLGQVGGRRKKFQNLTTGMIFSKIVSNLSVLKGIFETKL